MATGEHNHYVRDGETGLLYVEPKAPPSDKPLIDDLTRKMATGLQFAICPQNRWYRGSHQCSCGVRSDNKTYIIGRFSTNSLAVHYLAWHRHEVPQAELDKVASLVAVDYEDPTEAQLKRPEPVSQKFPENIEYEELRRGLSNLPMTFYPDLIRAMVEAAYQKNVFLDGGASVFVQNVEKKIGKQK